MRTSGKRKATCAGVTLVEVMLAGALTSLSVLATLEAFIVAGKIAHENAETLRADNVAFDLLWRKFYGDYEQMRSTVGQIVPEKNTDDTDSPYRSSSLGAPPSYAYREYVTPINNGNDGKLLAVTLKFGSEGQFTISNEVFRSDIPRMAN
jgi:hypothetical protein